MHPLTRGKIKLKTTYTNYTANLIEDVHFFFFGHIHELIPETFIEHSLHIGYYHWPWQHK